MKLKDIAKVQGGYAFKSDSFISGETPVIRIGNIVNNEVIIDNEITAPISTIGGRKEFLINKNDILIAMSGATVGKVGIYNYDYPSMLNQRVGNIKSDSKYQKYIYYLLQSPLFKKYVELSSFGCAQPNISGAQIENFEFKENAIEEISKIVSELDKVTSLINIRKKEIENCNNLIKSQFVEMFENEKNIITLDKICNKITDGSHNPPKGLDCETEYMMLSSQNIIDGKINFENPRFLTKEAFEFEYKRTNIEKGDILLTIVGTVGRTAIVNEEKVTLQRSVAVLKLNEEVNPYYVSYSFQDEFISSQLIKGAKGVAQKGIYLGDLKKIEIKVPPIELQNKFAKIVEQIDKQKFEFENSLKKLEELQASLMQEYFG